VVAASPKRDPVRELWDWYEAECLRRGYGRKQRKLSPEQRRRIAALLTHVGKTLGVDQAGAIESQRQHLLYRFAQADRGEREREFVRGNTPWVATAVGGRTPWWDWWHANVADKPAPRPNGQDKPSKLQQRAEEIRRRREQEAERG
jgi:hypothetical protein